MSSNAIFSSKLQTYLRPWVVRAAVGDKKRSERQIADVLHRGKNQERAVKGKEIAHRERGRISDLGKGVDQGEIRVVTRLS